MVRGVDCFRAVRALLQVAVLVVRFNVLFRHTGIASIMVEVAAHERSQSSHGIRAGHQFSIQVNLRVLERGYRAEDLRREVRNAVLYNLNFHNFKAPFGAPFRTRWADGLYSQAG